MFTDTVTLYNHYESGEQDMWHRTVLRNVQVSIDHGLTVSTDSKVLPTTTILVTIPYTDGYVAPKAYAGTGFTFGLDNLDVLIVGEATEEVSDQLSISQLMRLYQNAGTVMQVNDNTNRSLLKHWKVVAQ